MIYLPGKAFTIIIAVGKNDGLVERTFAFWLMPKMDRNIFFYS